MGINGVSLISYPTSFSDERGVYNELYNSSSVDFNVRQVSYVLNNQNVVRGMHGDWGTSKIVTVISGTVLQVCLDCRKASSTYGQVYSLVLHADDNQAVILPPGVANGFKVLSQAATYMYLQDTLYGDYEQFTVCPSTSDLQDVFGDLSDCIISERDRDLTKVLDLIGGPSRTAT